MCGGAIEGKGCQAVIITSLLRFNLKLGGLFHLYCLVHTPRRFCNCCWRSHFESQIGEGRSRDLRCMEFKCGAMCSHQKVRRLLDRGGRYSVLLSKFDQGYVGSYIEDNHNVRLCPSVPWCGSAIQVCQKRVVYGKKCGSFV